MCPQAEAGYLPNATSTDPSSEDCLFLDVIVPRTVLAGDVGDVPVLFWFVIWFQLSWENFVFTDVGKQDLRRSVLAGLQNGHGRPGELSQTFSEPGGVGGAQLQARKPRLAQRAEFHPERGDGGECGTARSALCDAVGAEVHPPVSRKQGHGDAHGRVGGFGVYLAPCHGVRGDGRDAVPEGVSDGPGGVSDGRACDCGGGVSGV